MSRSAFWLVPEPLVLASNSTARREMLEAAGIPIETMASGVDERAVEAPLLTRGADAPAVAAALALAKAGAVSAGLPGRVVLGADQILACGGAILHKAERLEAARERLAGLSGRTHELHSAFALVRDGAVLSEGVATARLTVRPLSDAFIAAYLGTIDPGTLASVGTYRMEAGGAQLFAGVEGDHFTILGLPLLPVLGALRAHGLLLA